MLSDHSLVQLDFEVGKPWTGGRGFWKFNTALLKDVEYINTINSWLDDFETEKHTFENKAMLWDFIKCKLRGVTISYSCFKAKERRNREAYLNNKISILEDNLSVSPS